MASCNCGICDLINDCYFDGRWEYCKVNKMIRTIESQQQEITELKERCEDGEDNHNISHSKNKELRLEIEQLRQKNDILESDIFHAQGNLEIVEDINKQLRNMLKRLEWNRYTTGEPYCIECVYPKRVGHKIGCELDKLLNR